MLIKTVKSATMIFSNLVYMCRSLNRHKCTKFYKLRSAPLEDKMRRTNYITEAAWSCRDVPKYLSKLPACRANIPACLTSLCWCVCDNETGQNSTITLLFRESFSAFFSKKFSFHKSFVSRGCM